MGYIVDWKCISCGYYIGPLYLGRGMHTPKGVDKDAYYCNECDTVFPANTYDQNIVCITCNSANIRNFNKEKSEICPKCKMETMKPDPLAGSWD